MGGPHATTSYGIMITCYGITSYGIIFYGIISYGIIP